MKFSGAILLAAAAACLSCVSHHQAMSMKMTKRFLLPYGFGYYCDCKSEEALTDKFCRYDCPWLQRRGFMTGPAKRTLVPAADLERAPEHVGMTAPQCDCRAAEEDLWRNPYCRKLCWHV